MRFASLFACVLLASLPCAAKWKLVWSDEFNGAAGTQPDPSKWNYALGGNGWGNHELETYTNSPDNIALDGNGNLIIRATAADGKYRSARINTKSHFDVLYGRIEARMQMPRGQGMWPAFWMLGNDIDGKHWPDCGEIDIVEMIGRQPNIVHGTIHGPGYSGAKGISHQYAAAHELPDKFHVYAVEWSPNKIVFEFDGHQYATVTPASLPSGTHWVYDHPFYLLLNLAVGGEWPGNPDASTRFPQELKIDWVRVYQKK